MQANGGTLLLDEVTEMELGLQAKLLRVLQEREVEPLGASKPVALDVRVLATSNRDLEQAVREGAFREDLYYRLSVFPLADRAAARATRRHRSARRALHCGTRRDAAGVVGRRPWHQLMAYPWPGNVRELENVVQRALLLCRRRTAHRARSTSCSSAARLVAGADRGGAGSPASSGKKRRAESSPRSKRHGGVRRQAAEQLGISDRTLRYKLSKMRAAGIHVPGDRAAAVVEHR